MIAQAWKFDSSDKYTYRIQIHEHLTKKQIEDLFSGWKHTGYGWNIKLGSKINIFQRDFSSEESWLEWVKKFPLSVVEYRTRAGVVKKVQLTNRKG